MKEVYIPNTVTHIGENVFNKVNSNFSIYGNSNSYAKQFCEENGINFVESTGNLEEEQKPNEDEQKPSEEQAPQGQQMKKKIKHKIIIKTMTKQ